METIKSTLQLLNTLTLKEIIPLYQYIDGWFAFYLYGDYAKNYMVNAILSYVGNEFIYRNGKYTFIQELQVFLLNKKRNRNINLEKLEETDNVIFIELSAKKEIFQTNTRAQIEKLRQRNMEFINKFFGNQPGFGEFVNGGDNKDKRIEILTTFEIEFNENSYSDINMKYGLLLKNYKKLYFDLAKKCHPDRPDGDDEKFKQLSNCYQYLNGVT